MSEFVVISDRLDSVFSAFFRRGQVIETVRGIGIYQPSVDTAIDKLNKGQWVCCVPFLRQLMFTHPRFTCSVRERSISLTPIPTMMVSPIFRASNGAC